MRFHRLDLRNWKNFRQVEGVELRDRMFLVGPNASGKSNFLDAFRFLRDLASSGSGGFQEAVRRRGGVKAMRCLAARASPEVGIAAFLEEKSGTRWEYRLVFGEGAGGRPAVREERVSRDGGEPLLDRPDEEDKQDTECLTQTHLEQVNRNRKFHALVEFFASIRYLHVVPQLIRDPGRVVARPDDPFGGDFLERIAGTHQRTRDARLRRMAKALSIAVPQLQEITLFRDRRGAPHIRGKFRHWRPRGAHQTEEQFSDGTLRLAGLLWAVMEKEEVLLLEEPELSLHAGIVRRLPQMLARVSGRGRKQVFLSTHSPELLRDEGIGLDETLLFTPDEEGTGVRLAFSDGEVRTLLQGGLSLSDVVIPRTQPRDAEQLTLFPE